MKNLINIKSLNKDEIEQIISLAKEYKKGLKKDFSSFHAALMFFENSTRTRFSFECALNKLNARSYIFDNSKSSTNKGEEIYDTVNNLSAIGISTFIIRTKDENLIEDLAQKEYFAPVHFINAGSGKISHPTQALLDYFTMKEKIGDVKGKKIVIIGDIKHSRVAKSNCELLSKMGADVRFAAPDYFKQENDNIKYEQNLNSVLEGADVVMCLRIQNERLESEIDKCGFIKNFQINEKNFPKNALLMHPGPVNRGVEIDSNLLDSKHGKTILEQAQNGVYIRMAVLDIIFGGKK